MKQLGKKSADGPDGTGSSERAPTANFSNAREALVGLREWWSGRPHPDTITSFDEIIARAVTGDTSAAIDLLDCAAGILEERQEFPPQLRLHIAHSLHAVVREMDTGKSKDRAERVLKALFLGKKGGRPKASVLRDNAIREAVEFLHGRGGKKSIAPGAKSWGAFEVVGTWCTEHGEKIKAEQIKDICRPVRK